MVGTSLVLIGFFGSMMFCDNYNVWSAFFTIAAVGAVILILTALGVAVCAETKRQACHWICKD